MKRNPILFGILTFFVVTTTSCKDKSLLPYQNDKLSIEERVNDLVSRMTMDEKISQMMNSADTIARLGIPSYQWWNEGLHGVGRAGIATVFPQAIGMGATFNDSLLFVEATAISNEFRAKYNEYQRQKDNGQYKGLTVWSPNINIFRDPRWGRGQETYGEDPWLTSRMGVAFVKGLQGNDPVYLKTVATPKHYVVHSGPESTRHIYNANISDRDFYETYTPAFEACVKEGKAYSVMSAYNRFRGKSCSGSDTLLTDILRKEWGFSGYVVSDCGAIYDIYATHKIVTSPAEAAAIGVKAGCDLECGDTYSHLKEAVEKGFITEKDIDVAVKRLFTARFKLGMFDPQNKVPYNNIPYSVNDCKEHRDLSLTTALQSLVLLKNDNNLLPLKKDLAAIAVFGPNANERDVMYGNYNGFPSKSVTVLEGIKSIVSPHTKVYYHQATNLAGTAPGADQALDLAKKADVSIFVGGLSPSLEGEEMDVQMEGFSGGDRVSIDLPASQANFLKRLVNAGKPVVLVLLNGSALSINWESKNIPAILEAWYPGQEGGTAVAKALFGDYNPGGRLPVTFYKSVNDIPGFDNYDMEGRTYRYFRGEPLYPFGYGLSYSKFAYSHLKLSAVRIGKDDVLTVTADIKNTGVRDGDEVVQLYIKDMEATSPRPIKELKGFSRISLKAGETKTVKFNLNPMQLQMINNRGEKVIEPGSFEVLIGSSSADIKLKETFTYKQ